MRLSNRSTLCAVLATCQTQLNEDLKECTENFKGIFKSNPVLEACIGGAVRANIACLDKQEVR
jgi:hypothetical protein